MSKSIITIMKRPANWKPIPEAEQTSNIKPKKHKVTTTTKTPKKKSSGNKIVMATTLLTEHKPASRKAAISILMNELDMTPAGASTYASNINKTHNIW